MGMQIGVAIAFNHLTTPDYIADAARFIEDAGFHSLWVPEHVLLFPEYHRAIPTRQTVECPATRKACSIRSAALTFVAAHTKRVRLGTGICLVPQRQPVYTAKMVADLDYLSGGRVDFGVGIGWLAEEFQALGMDFRVRARRCAEYIDAMKALWADGVVVVFRRNGAHRVVLLQPKAGAEAAPADLLWRRKRPCTCTRCDSR